MSERRRTKRGNQPKTVALRPRDAASLLVVDMSQGSPSVLLGRRHPRQVFVPNKFVFPGGRVEVADSRLAPGGDLNSHDAALLLHDMKGRASPRRARALPLAAVRETFEETGFLIGAEAETPAAVRPGHCWETYLNAGALPEPANLRFIARAITPPGRPRRYDTRFFLVSAERIVRRIGEGDGEFTELVWATFDEARALDLHAMTRTVLGDAEDVIGDGSWLSAVSSSAAKIPYYYSRNGHFRRDLISSPGRA